MPLQPIPMFSDVEHLLAQKLFRKIVLGISLAAFGSGSALLVVALVRAPTRE